MKCPHCTNDERDMLEVLSTRTIAGPNNEDKVMLVILCNNCAKESLVSVEDVEGT